MDGVNVDLFSQNEILLMIGVVSVLLFSILILAILDFKDRRKLKNNHEMVKDDEIEFGEKMEEALKVLPKTEETIEVLELSNEVTINDVKEDVLNSVIVPENENSINVVEEKKVDLEEELNKALESIPIEEAVNNYEMEQERTAIISLDELMQKSDSLYNDNEVSQYDDGDEPISIDEVINRFNAKEEKSVPEVMRNIVEDNNKMSFENTATYEKLSRESNSEFVAKLREASENK